MVHPVRDCILSNKYILNLFVSLALIAAYLYVNKYAFVAALEQKRPPEVATCQLANDEFHEDLYIRPMSDGKLLAHFEFVTTYRKDIKSLRWENKIEILPLSIVDLVTSTSLTKLHFSLTKGNWNYESWGYPIRSSPAGAQIKASFSRHKSGKNLYETWRRLTNSLAGRFCASLESADERILVRPKLSFLDDHTNSAISPSNIEELNNINNSTNQHVLYANLPEETLCTGNLTPWKKLLPCYSNSGLASLLNAINLFKSSHSSLAVVLEPKLCFDKHEKLIPDCERVQLKQSITVVFNPLLQFEGKQTWSLAKIFGASIKKMCPVAKHSLVHVEITDLDDKTKLYPQQPSYREYSINISQNTLARNYATFDLKQLMASTDKALNLGVKQNQLFKRPAYSSRKPIPLSLRTHIAGLGAYDGTIVATIANSLSEPVRVTYMDIVPHFMRLYLHTLHIRLTESGQELKPDQLNYVLSHDDRSPSLIEFSIMLPAQSETQISYDFERAFLRWTDFKPDANKGVLLSSAMITVLTRQHAQLKEMLAIPLCSSRAFVKTKETKIRPLNATYSEVEELNLAGRDEEDELVRIYSRPLLLILPTPDFSMPYNVLCLVSTALVFAFGPIYNLAIRRPVIKRKKLQKSASTSSTEAEEKKSTTKID